MFKFGVTGLDLRRFKSSLAAAGKGAKGIVSSSAYTKSQAHLYEKYLRSLHFNSTGLRELQGMKVPYPVDFKTGKPIGLK